MLYDTSKILFSSLLTEINKPGEKYKVTKYMLSGPHYQEIKQRTRWLSAHKVFCCESELNHIGTRVI